MSDKTKTASSIQVVACEHGNVHVALLDEKGEVFALATMDAETADTFAVDLDEAIEEAIGASIGGLH